MNKENEQQIIEYITRRGEEITPAFFIAQDQREFYLNAFAYFRGEERVFDIRKGLLITGTVGTGKTTAMQILRLMGKPFKIVSTREVIRDYMINPNPAKTLDTYGRKSYKSLNSIGEGSIDLSRPIHLCFDDIGNENVNVKNFGNDQNIMEEILTDRYNEWKKTGMKTYGTSNLTAAQIEDAYGLRVRDRIKEMMNFVTLTGESKRK